MNQNPLRKLVQFIFRRALSEFPWPNLTQPAKFFSIVCNLAEGGGKAKPKDRLRFFEIAMGSLRESQALIELLDNPPLQKKADQLGAYLWNLMKTLR